MRIRTRFAPLLALGALATGCGPLPGLSPAQSTVALEFSQLRPIEARYGHYEAWATVDGAPRSLGKFNVDDAGHLVDLAGAAKGPAVLDVSPSAIEKISVTQELPGDQDAVPSKQVFLEGPAKDGSASLATPVAASYWAESKGVYILDDPFTWKDGTDYNGLWFGYFDQTAKAYQTGLTVPDAPEGWMYSAWVVLDGIPLRVGKFHSAMDNDDYSVYSGRDGASPLIDPVGRPMPGEDFVTRLPEGIEIGYNKPSLGGARVIVSLESATLAHEDQYPSPVRIFEGTVPEPPAQRQAYDLDNVSASAVPTGTATIH